MNASYVSQTPGRRTGAMWVAATGAFLILAAAAVFVATRWDDIPEGAKLALLVGLTGACVVAGDRIRPGLPATGPAVVHLGALLIPVDGAALGLRIGLEWEELLSHPSKRGGASSSLEGERRVLVGEQQEVRLHP